MIIYKYKLPIEDRVEVSLPNNAEILTIQPQNGNCYIWVKFDDWFKDKDEYIKYKTRVFRVIGTGNNFNDNGLKYITTVQIGIFVWHIYEEIE